MAIRSVWLCMKYHIHSRRHILILLAIIPVLLSLGGCFTYHRASGEASAPTTLTSLAPLTPDAWPNFDTAPLEPLVETPKVLERNQIESVDDLPLWSTDTSDEWIEIMRNFHTDDLLISHLDEHGLIRMWKNRQRDSLNRVPGATDWKPTDFDRNASYLTGPVALWEKERERIEFEMTGKRPRASLRSSIYGLKPTGIEEQWQLNHGLELAIPEFVPDDPAGLIIHITGLMETKYEEALTNRLKAHGYAAAYIESDIFLDGPNAHARRVRSAQRKKRRAELREERADENPLRIPGEEREIDHPSQALRDAHWDFLNNIYKQVDEELPQIENGFQIYPDTDLEELGRVIAKIVDDKIAEHAYAAEAIVWASDERFPALADKPIVVLGYSAGSLVAPGVVARLKAVYPDRPIRLILVGSGGDLLTVSTQSTFGYGILRFKPKSGPEPTDEQIETLKAAYLSATRLDPLVLMPTIRDVPVLHLYASKDTIVPAIAAKMLNNAHGHVDRLKHFGNHGTLFYFAQTQAGRVRSWLRDQDTN
jgi:hypothetical protein